MGIDLLIKRSPAHLSSPIMLFSKSLKLALARACELGVTHAKYFSSRKQIEVIAKGTGKFTINFNTAEDFTIFRKVLETMGVKEIPRRRLRTAAVKTGLLARTCAVLRHGARTP